MPSFKQFLVEFTENTTKLTNTPEFKKFKEADSAFADKLEKAWAGDIVDQRRGPSKFDPLFTKMLDMSAIKKFSPKSTHLSSEAQKLQALQRQVFKHTVHQPSANKSTDLWAYEPYKK